MSSHLSISLGLIFISPPLLDFHFSALPLHNAKRTMNAEGVLCFSPPPLASSFHIGKAAAININRVTLVLRRTRSRLSTVLGVLSIRN